MPKQMKQCRVCGESYEACNSAKTGTNVFNWREVACSPECGAEYLRRVNEARNPAPKSKRGLRTKVHPVDEVIEPAQEIVDVVISESDIEYEPTAEIVIE